MNWLTAYGMIQPRTPEWQLPLPASKGHLVGHLVMQHGLHHGVGACPQVACEPALEIVDLQSGGTMLSNWFSLSLYMQGLVPLTNIIPPVTLEGEHHLQLPSGALHWRIQGGMPPKARNSIFCPPQTTDFWPFFFKILCFLRFFSRFGTPPPKTMFWPPPNLSPGSANGALHHDDTVSCVSILLAQVDIYQNSCYV